MLILEKKFCLLVWSRTACHNPRPRPCWPSGHVRVTVPATLNKRLGLTSSNRNKKNSKKLKKRPTPLKIQRQKKRREQHAVTESDKAGPLEGREREIFFLLSRIIWKQKVLFLCSGELETLMSGVYTKYCIFN